MKRRTFLDKTSKAALLMAASPQGFSTTESMDILGQGKKTYRLNKAWSQAEVSRFPVKDCHEMVQDSKGRILLLTNETKNNILIYDKAGKLLQTWGNDFPGGHGLTLFDEGGQDVLFICDNNRHQVIKTTIDGRVLMTLDYPVMTGLYSKADEYIPTETAIAPNGDIYVVDGYGKDLVIQYNHKGEYLRHFGGRGPNPEHLVNAHGICIDRRKGRFELLITSREQHAFKRYTMEGKYLGTIALPGAWVCRPVIKDDYLYAAVLQSQNSLWKQSGFVTILDQDNRVVSNLGGSTPQYMEGQLQEMSQEGKYFSYPHDVCVDDEGCLYVAQWNSGQAYPYKLEPVI